MPPKKKITPTIQTTMFTEATPGTSNIKASKSLAVGDAAIKLEQFKAANARILAAAKENAARVKATEPEKKPETVKPGAKPKQKGKKSNAEPIVWAPSKWSPTAVKDLPSWQGQKLVAFDSETCDPLIKTLGCGALRDGSKMVGFSFSFEDGRGYYVPFDHEGGGNVSKEHALAYLKDQSVHFSGELVGAKISYDLAYLRAMGIWFDRVKYYRDVQVADPILYELHYSYSLDNIAKRMSLEGKDEELLNEIALKHGLNPKADMWRLPAEYVEKYAIKDATLSMDIYQRQRRLLEEQDLMKIFNLESEVLPVLVKMHHRGVRIDLGQLERVEKYSVDEETKALNEVHRITGKRIALGDVFKVGILVPILQEVGIKLPKTPTGKPSIKKDDMFNYKHPVADAINWARRVNKLRTTFAASVRNHMIKGRIHCNFNQIAMESDQGEQKGARYGRLSCSNPNLQQQPSRDEFASMWRSIYIPEQGAIWACNDYSQQEPRWTTHFAAVCDLPMAKEAAKEYRENPATDNHDMMAKLTGLDRKKAKAVYLGLCYGEGGAKLCHDMGLPTRWTLIIGSGYDRHSYFFNSKKECMEASKNYKDVKKYAYECAGKEGQDILDKFDSRAPFIRKLALKVKKRADNYGFIRTILGRRLNFQMKDDLSGYDWTYKGLNRLIQGSSADQSKLAGVILDKEMPKDFIMHLQVHDEYDGSVETPKQAVMAAEIMRECIQATVPFKVDIELGTSWGTMTDYSACMVMP